MCFRQEGGCQPCSSSSSTSQQQRQQSVTGVAAGMGRGWWLAQAQERGVCWSPTLDASSWARTGACVHTRPLTCRTAGTMQVPMTAAAARHSATSVVALADDVAACSMAPVWWQGREQEGGQGWMAAGQCGSVRVCALLAPVTSLEAATDQPPTLYCCCYCQAADGLGRLQLATLQHSCKL